MGALWRRLVGLFRRDHLAADLDEEIRDHYEHLRRTLEDDGHAPDEAARLARLRLGGTARIQEAARDEWRLGRIEDWAQDVRHAARGLRRRPGFAAAAVATLALGIGASTAIFSVAYGVSLRPLPLPDPDRLLRLYESNPASGQTEANVSDGIFQAWREGTPSASMALHTAGAPWTLALGPDRVRVTSMSVTPEFFDVLGVRPLLGAGFKPEREYTRFTTRDVVLSFDLWQRLFGGRADIVGQTVTEVSGNDDDVYRIVGVMPQGFSFVLPADIWRPQIIEVPVARILYNWRYDRVVARLKPGATIEQARAEIEAASARVAAERPASNAGWTATVRTLHDSVVGDFGRSTWLLLASVGVVLLVACLNVGGLLVARAVARDRETALRVALGAGRWRLVRLWLSEGALIAAAGGGLGWLLATLGVSALKAAAPPGIPRLDAIAMDGAALTTVAAATTLALIVFAVAPLGRLGRGGPAAGALSAGTTGAGESRGRQATRAAITAAQCAGAAVLVVLAALLTRSFVTLTSVDLGWNPDRVLTVVASPPIPRDLQRPWYRYVEWSDRLIARLEATPGIERAAMANPLPLTATAGRTTTFARGRGRQASTEDLRWTGIKQIVSDHYFDLMGIRLTRGRLFDDGDRFSEDQLNGRAGNGRGVAVVSEATARLLWPGADPVGQPLWLPDIDSVAWREVVGVVEDLQFNAVGETPPPHVFVPRGQDGNRATLLAKATGSAADLAPIVRAILEEIEPGTEIGAVATLDSIVSNATAGPRFTSRLVVAFGGLALVLAAVGIYGTLAFLVGSRTREIGVRLALGASRRGVLALVLRRGLVPAAIGATIGLGLAAVLAQTFASLLFEVAPLDPASFAGGTALLLGVAVVAALGPARRAAATDPVQALRSE